MMETFFKELVDSQYSTPIITATTWSSPKLLGTSVKSVFPVTRKDFLNINHDDTHDVSKYNDDFCNFNLNDLEPPLLLSLSLVSSPSPDEKAKLLLNFDNDFENFENDNDTTTHQYQYQCRSSIKDCFLFNHRHRHRRKEQPVLLVTMEKVVDSNAPRVATTRQNHKHGPLIHPSPIIKTRSHKRKLEAIMQPVTTAELPPITITSSTTTNLVNPTPTPSSCTMKNKKKKKKKKLSPITASDDDSICKNHDSMICRSIHCPKKSHTCTQCLQLRPNESFGYFKETKLRKRQGDCCKTGPRIVHQLKSRTFKLN